MVRSARRSTEGSQHQTSQSRSSGDASRQAGASKSTTLPGTYQEQSERLRPSGVRANLKLPVTPLPVLILAGLPPTTSPADTIDLTNPATLPAELGKRTARYVHVLAGGTDVYLDLGSPRDDAALTALTQNLLGSGGTLRAGVDLTTWFTFDGTDLVAGREERTGAITSGVERSGEVLEQSNKRSNVDPNLPNGDPLGTKMDALWQFLNGGRTELEMPEGKDASWYNGLELTADGKGVTTRKSPKDARAGNGPTLSLVEYRQMLVRDFNYSGAISEFAAAGGESAFVSAVLESRHDVDPATLRIIAREIWSYATTGADTHGVTNIAQMQGYLHAFDPKIALSSDTNTPIEDTFNAGTPDAPLRLPLGDGKHGRATVLSTRHLLAQVHFETLAPSRIATRREVVMFTADDQFVRDDSQSMDSKWSTIATGVDQALKLGAYAPAGSTTPSIATNTLGTFDHKEVSVPNASGSANVDGTGEVMNFAKLLEDAWNKLATTKSRNDAKSFAALFGLEGAMNTFFTPHGGVYDLDGAALMSMVGDGGSLAHGAQGESGIKAILGVLLYDPAYTSSSSAPPRLNLVADEPEQGLEYLQLAQALSQKMGVEVRFVAVPTHPTSFAPQTDLAIIPLSSMSVVNTGAGYQLTFMATQNGVTSSRTETLAFGNGSSMQDPSRPLWRAYAPLMPTQDLVLPTH